MAEPLLAELVTASADVAATASRSQKVARMAALLATLGGGDLSIAVCFLTGAPRQGKLGVGWATLSAIDSQPAREPTITLAEVDLALGDLRQLGGQGSGASRAAALAALFGRATAAEQSFLRRLVIGDLRQGALEGVVTDAVAKATGTPLAAVRRAAMLAGDLARVAAVAAESGAEGLARVGLTLLSPIQPMLASTSAGVADALALTGRASVEWKLDGIRLQVHRLGDDVRLFTRNLNDVTDRMPAVVDLVKALPGHALVLDGEVMSREVRFFDVIHRDGVDLLDLPLSERRAVLEEVAAAAAIPNVVTDDADEATAFLQGAIEAGHEGVVVKALGSTYEAGRRGGSWRKVKPVLTLDLVVVGVEWGSGRRQGWLSNLHLAARNPDGGFLMVGKTFKGLTDELLAWQTERLQQLAIETRGHTVLVRPELVVEVALDGAQISTRYEGGVGLRFARVKRYRPDKSAAEADTIDAVRALAR